MKESATRIAFALLAVFFVVGMLGPALLVATTEGVAFGKGAYYENCIKAGNGCKAR